MCSLNEGAQMRLMTLGPYCLWTKEIYEYIGVLFILGYSGHLDH